MSWKKQFLRSLATSMATAPVTAGRAKDRKALVRLFDFNSRFPLRGLLRKMKYGSSLSPVVLPAFGEFRVRDLIVGGLSLYGQASYLSISSGQVAEKNIFLKLCDSILSAFSSHLRHR